MKNYKVLKLLCFSLSLSLPLSSMINLFIYLISIENETIYEYKCISSENKTKTTKYTFQKSLRMCQIKMCVQCSAHNHHRGVLLLYVQLLLKYIVGAVATFEYGCFCCKFFKIHFLNNWKKSLYFGR